MKSFLLTLVCLLGLVAPAYAQQEVDATALLFWAGGSPRCEGRVGSGAPSGGNSCDFYLDYSTGRMYTKIGSTWTLVGNISGTLTATRVPFADSATSLTDDADMTFATDTLSITKVNSPYVRSNYTSGFAGSGYTLDYNTSVASQSYLETDQLTVRGIFNVYELLVHQIRATNGSIYVANTGKIETATGLGGVAYALTTETDHGFAVDDIIRAQRYTGTGTYQVDMQVTSVGSSTAFNADRLGASPSPQPGMDFVRLGSTSDTSRQGSIYLTADDTNAPYINILDGVTSIATWGTSAKTKVRIGQLNGVCSYAASAYGLCAGDGAGTFVSVDSTNGFRAVSGGITKMSLDTSGNAYFAGQIIAASGTIGSFTIGTYLYTGSKTAYNDTNAGVHVGGDGIGIGNNVFTVSSAGALVATSATISGSITATTGAIGGFNIGADYIRDTANSMGLASTVSGSDDVRFWAGDTFANRAAAIFRVTEAGALVASNANIVGASGYVTINSDGIKIPYVLTKATTNGYKFVSAGGGVLPEANDSFGMYTSSALAPGFATIIESIGIVSNLQGPAILLRTGADSGGAASVEITANYYDGNPSFTTYSRTRINADYIELEGTIRDQGGSWSITSAGVVSFPGTTNNVGTITTGVWNAGAVTSSGTVAGVAGTFSGIVTATGGLGIGAAPFPGEIHVYDNSSGGTIRLSRDAGLARGALYFGRANSGSFQNVASINGLSDSTSVNNGYFDFQTSDGAGAMTARMQIKAGVTIGGTTDPGATNFRVEGTTTLVGNGASGAGDVFACVTTGDLITQGATCLASAREFKTNIRPFTNGLETALALKPSTFDWRYDKSHDLGFIADEVNAVDSRLGIWQNGKLFSVKDRGLIMVSISAIQEQQALIKALTQRIERLEKRK